MLQDLTTGVGIEEGSVLGNFVFDVTSDDPSEGLGDILGTAGLVGLLGVAGGALAATTSLGDVLSGTPSSDDPAVEARAALVLRTLVQIAKADGLSFAEKQAFLDRIDRSNPRDALALNALFNAPVDAATLAQDTSEADRDLVLTTAQRAAKSNAARAYVAQLSDAFGAS